MIKELVVATQNLGKLEEFKVLFHKLPKTLTQIAFGIGDLQDLDAEMWKIFDYCRHNDYQEVIPNVTINGNFLTYDKAHKLKELMGAVAVSRIKYKQRKYFRKKKDAK